MSKVIINSSVAVTASQSEPNHLILSSHVSFTYEKETKGKQNERRHEEISCNRVNTKILALEQKSYIA